IEISSASGSSLFTPVPAARPPVLILTHGRNGLGAFPMPPDATSLSTARPLPTTTSEAENTDQDGTFHLGGDDQMIWIPTTVIQYYVLKSGRTL
ncbi:MAG: hypothetical protein HQM00_12175, partial [Magnetococcales bacterium]|nr:hypothetical protein [Magnetococcales bacterium]